MKVKKGKYKKFETSERQNITKERKKMKTCISLTLYFFPLFSILPFFDYFLELWVSASGRLIRGRGAVWPITVRPSSSAHSSLATN